MCGIAGVFSSEQVLDLKEELYTASVNKLLHRGPDHSAIVSAPHFTFVHTRLAILDLDPRSNQPLWSECKRYVIAFNGEIYNYKSIRHELQEAFPEINFRTEGDTEVLLQLMRYWGVTALSKLEGCFAFAFLDTQEKQLTLVRDRMGVNPLWFERLPEGVVQFASERKALPLKGRRALNLPAIHDFLRLTYIPGPQSAELGIEKVKPGHYLTFPGEGKQTCWYSLPETFEQKSAPSPHADLQATLRQAVADRLVADVAVGSFLSGGLDSSIISALAASLHPNLSTFSVGFQSFGYLDESAHAKAVAQHIGSRHHCFEMKADDLVEHAERVLSHLDEPFADASAIAVSFLAERTRKEVKVVLSGDGADELFGGYRKHRGHALALHPLSRFGNLLHPLVRAKQSKSGSSREAADSDRWRQLGRFLDARSMSPPERYRFWSQFTPDELIESALGVSLIEADLPAFSDDELQDVLMHDQLQVLPYDMLTKVDLMSMRYNLEVRVPFLDSRVIALANSLPAAAKFNHRRGKIALAAAFSELLPERVFQRRKQGFEIPLEWLLREGLRSQVEALKTSNFEELGFDPLKLKASVEAFFQGDSRLSSLMWSLLALKSWMERGN